mmetsp:Transcript_337/g.499  ORF Transcript_337/g.499 Transcript_337/m.499 type:complete len:200 (-) Transcript_337:1488-2087(-)
METLSSPQCMLGLRLLVSHNIACTQLTQTELILWMEMCIDLLIELMTSFPELVPLQVSVQNKRIIQMKTLQALVAYIQTPNHQHLFSRSVSKAWEAKVVIMVQHVNIHALSLLTLAGTVMTFLDNTSIARVKLLSILLLLSFLDVLDYGVQHLFLQWRANLHSTCTLGLGRLTLCPLHPHLTLCSHRLRLFQRLSMVSQ